MINPCSEEMKSFANFELSLVDESDEQDDMEDEEEEEEEEPIDERDTRCMAILFVNLLLISRSNYFMFITIVQCPEPIRFKQALIYDGILLLTEALKQIGERDINPKQLKCSENDFWDRGYTISGFMKSVNDLNT